MRVTQTALPGLLFIEPLVRADARGAFAESFRAQTYAEAGIPAAFVQDNISWSERNVIRGLHYQHPRAQAKLITVLHGVIYDVAVDLRPDSPTYMKWLGVELSGDALRQLYIPEGFAHGFAVLSERAIVSYKCSQYYSPGDEHCLRWNDPQLDIRWPLTEPILSEKDATAPLLADTPTATSGD